MADLIDRAVILRKNCHAPAKGNCNKCEWEGDSHCSCEIFGVQLASAPAVDAVEVKHGHWQEYEDYCLTVYYDCSVCGGTFYMADGTPTENGYNFCPKCGARMGETIRVELENDEID